MNWPGNEGKAYFEVHKETITGAEFYRYTCSLVKIRLGIRQRTKALIGNFPHENIYGEEEVNYIHPNNNLPMLVFTNNVSAALDL